jgi:hypothetical protein
VIYLKKFLEFYQGYGDEYQISWAGSSWAFKNPEIPIDPKEEPIPLKQSYPYICQSCDLVYYFIPEDGEPFCPSCGKDKSDGDNNI